MKEAGYEDPFSEWKIQAEFVDLCSLNGEDF